MMRFLRKKSRIYLDYAAATPVRSEVLSAMRPYWSDQFANASGVHKEGVQARRAVEQAREEVARTLRVRAPGIIFTGSGSESNNLAIYGLLRELTESDRAFSECEIISTATEHPSVFEALKHLQGHGVTVKTVSVDQEGMIDTKELETLLTPKTVLVTFAYANSETGVVQDVKRVTRIVRKYNTAHNAQTLVHIDASQAPLWQPCQFDVLGVDMMTLDVGKCYGPKGIGVLALRHGVAIKGIILGGGQEHGLRAGTENTALIVGCARAIIIAQEGYEKRSDRVVKLRDQLITDLLQIEGVILNGSTKDRLANNVNISIPGLDSEYAVIVLDSKGIACSTKSACSGASGGGSVAVEVMTHDTARATSTIRFSLGEETTARDLKKVVAVLADHVAKNEDFNTNLG